MSILNTKFNALTLIAAIVASLAATASAGLGWPVWAMFIGWVAFFTGEHSFKGALSSYICVAIGIALGNAAGLAVGSLSLTILHLARSSLSSLSPLFLCVPPRLLTISQPTFWA